MHDGMKNSLSVDATPPVFLDAQRNGDMSLGPLFTSYSVYAGEAIAMDEISSDKAIPVYGSNGIRGYSDSANFFEDQVLVGRQGSVGTVHFAKAPFWASEHALIVKPRRDGSDKRWLKYVLEAADLQRLSRSVAQPGINATSVGFQRIPNIPSCEQSRIADYLDRETAEIDAAVADLDKYVELLEKRRLEIFRRKTRYDASGSEWGRCATSLVFRSIGSGTTPKKDGGFYSSPDDENGVPWVTTSELREKYSPNECFCNPKGSPGSFIALYSPCWRSSNSHVWGNYWKARDTWGPCGYEPGLLRIF